MKKLFLFTLSACLLSACSSDNDIVVPEETTPTPITLSAKSLSIEVDTKTPYVATTPSSSATLVARVVSSQTSGTYTTLYSNGQMSFISESLTPYDDTPSTTKYYPASGDLYFQGFAPYASWGEPTSGVITATIDGKIDLMYAGQEAGSKTDSAKLAFNHLLTLLRVSVEAADAAAISAWGNITSIELTKAGTSASNTGLTLTMADGSVAATASSAGNISFWKASVSESAIAYTDDAITPFALTVAETPPLVAYSMVEPVTVSEGAHYTLKVKSAIHTSGVDVPINLKQTGGNAFTANTVGKAFNINLTFKSTEIKATASVTAWADSGYAEEVVE